MMRHISPMPAHLRKAHQKLDAAVDRAYQIAGGSRTYTSDAARVAFLFALYQRYVQADAPARTAQSCR